MVQANPEKTDAFYAKNVPLTDCYADLIRASDSFLAFRNWHHSEGILSDMTVAAVFSGCVNIGW